VKYKPGKNIFILPCDHRDILVDYWEQNKQKIIKPKGDWITAAKDVVLEGLLKAVEMGVEKSSVALLMEEEFGAPVLSKAKEYGICRYVPVDEGTVGPFVIQYGESFPDHVEKMDPEVVQCLINFNPEAPNAAEQIESFKPLPEWLKTQKRAFMLELQVMPTEKQLIGKTKEEWIAEERPKMIRKAITGLRNVGAEPDIWKIEQQGTCEEYKKTMDILQADGRDHVVAVVLGGGADNSTVESWLRMSARIEGYVGFAVGRTCWRRGIENFAAGTWDAEKAAEDIAQNYYHFVQVFIEGEKHK
jgi:myo-inositol catabolism protein IolC